MQIEVIPVGDLVGYERNARTHSSEQVAQIVASIREYGFTNPVLVDESTVLIAGHGRTEAAKAMGMESVPAVRLSNLTETQKRALRIADNQLSLNAGWDEELLAMEIMDLQDVDFDMSMLGFADEQLAEILSIVEDGGDDDYNPPLADGERSPIRTTTFTLSADQLELVEECLQIAKDAGAEDPDGINANSNGNALWYVCKKFKNGVAK